MFSDWVTQTIRLYDAADFIEVTYTVGPVPFHDGEGREVVTVWTTGPFIRDFTRIIAADINANQTWYTDSNGRDMQQRKFNYRPTWHLTVLDPFGQDITSIGNVLVACPITSFPWMRALR